MAEMISDRILDSDWKPVEGNSLQLIPDNSCTIFSLHCDAICCDIYVYHKFPPDSDSELKDPENRLIFDEVKAYKEYGAIFGPPCIILQSIIDLYVSDVS